MITNHSQGGFVNLEPQTVGIVAIALVCTLRLLVPVLQPEVLSLAGWSVTDVSNVGQGDGIGYDDILFLVLYYIMAELTLFAVALVLCFKTRGHLAVLNNKIAAIENDLRIQGKPRSMETTATYLSVFLGKSGYNIKLKAYMGLIYIVAVLAALCSTAMARRIYNVMGAEYHLLGAIFVGLVWFFHVLVAMAPPMIISLMTLFLVLSENLKITIKTYSESLASMITEDISTTGTIKSIGLRTVNMFANVGFDILDAYDNLEQTFATFIVLDLGFNLSALVIGLFYAIHIVGYLESIVQNMGTSL